MTNKQWVPALAVGLVLRVLLAWYGHGFRHMDESWQVLEPANYLVHGVFSRTWEWDFGLRSWIYPWLVSGLLRFAEAIGIQEPLSIAAFTRMWHGLFSLVAIPLTFAVVRASASDRMAKWASWVVAIWPYAVFCGVRTHNEMFGAVFVLAAIAAPALLLKRLGEAPAYFLAGAIFGVALALKIDLAVAGLGYGAWQVLTRRWKRAAFLALGVIPLVLLIGIVDRYTWGTWFHSVFARWQSNIVQGAGNQWGVSPWYIHVVNYFDIISVPAVVAFFLLPRAWKRLPEQVRAIWFMNAFFVAAFCAIPHKEKRFLAPIIYTGQVAAFATLAYVQLNLSKARRKLAFATCAVVFAAHFGANGVTYWVKRPWWNRLSSIYMAGKVPGVEKMFSPQWPANFYLPRHMPAESVKADDESLREKTKGLTRISVATDWHELKPFERIGFKCTPWPENKPHSADPLPWAQKCVR